MPRRGLASKASAIFWIARLLALFVRSALAAATSCSCVSGASPSAAVSSAAAAAAGSSAEAAATAAAAAGSPHVARTMAWRASTESRCATSGGPATGKAAFEMALVRSSSRSVRRLSQSKWVYSRSGSCGSSHSCSSISMSISRWSRISRPVGEGGT
eukprot:scaffold95505_cov63-Phaeocystis_antarctica.AAC.1